MHLKSKFDSFAEVSEQLNSVYSLHQSSAQSKHDISISLLIIQEGSKMFRSDHPER